MSSFQRRVGAAADICELEFVAALHQTCMPSLRKDGTVSSIDILRFLKSRTNLNVSHEHCLRIVRGLGGGLIGDDVIRHIIETQPTPEQEMKQKKKRFKSKIRLASSLSKLRKRKEPDEETDIPQGPFGIQGRKGEDSKNGGRHDESESNEDPKDPYDDVDRADVEAEEFLDIVQLTGILLMPTLARAGKEWKDSQLPEVHQEESSPPDYRGVKGWIGKKLDQYKEKEKDTDEKLHKSLDPKPATLIPDVLHTMLSSVDTSSNINIDSSRYPPVSARLVRNLLMASGECERAQDRVLVDRMVEAASSSSGLFDEEAFVNALTRDLSLWNVGSEDRQTTSFFDVYGFESYREKGIVEEQQKETAIEAAKSQQEDGSNHRLSKAGIVSQAGSTSAMSGAADEASVEDDIVPAVVGYDSARKSLDTSMSVMSVITMEDSVFEMTTAKDSGDVQGGSSYKFDRTHTPLDIDLAIDAHSSIIMTVAIFFFFMCTSLVYATLILRIPELEPNCGTSFGCTLGAKVILWMLFACVLAGTGYFVIIPLSLGNQPAERSPRRLVLAFVLCLLITWMPFLAVELYEQSLEPPYSGTGLAVNSPNYNGAQWVTRFLGTLTCIFMLWQFVLACIGNQGIRNNVFMRKYFSSSAIKGTARQKKAATRKVNRMLENAHTLNPKSEGGYLGSAAKEETMMNFVLRGESFETIGGLVWTWKRLLSGRLFDEDGVWIASRLIIIQVVQFCLTAFYAYTGVVIVQEVARQAQSFQDNLQPGYPEWVYTFVPTPQQAQAALYPAVGVAVFVMLFIFLIYIPSYVRSIFQFRCGIRPSLKSSDFLKYRVAVDAVYTNIGNAVFGMIGSAFLFFFLIGLVLFLFIWPFSKGFMILLLAWALGLAITIILKIIIVKNCRKRFYAGFYRTNPNAANLATLALECWFIGMGGGVLVGRFTQFILAACFYVGRTDVPFLSKDVSLFGYAFDYVPTNFTKDVLVHEAHRHPYFERLFSMYLMKLKNDQFSNEAGACWRQLFVVTLMPWLIKLRVFSDKRLEGIDLAQYNAARLEQVSSRSLSTTLDLDLEMKYQWETVSMLGEVTEEGEMEEEDEPLNA